MWRFGRIIIKNDYYVYIHKTLDGVVFYVGKGRGLRSQRKDRSRHWKEAAINGFSIEILHSELTESESLIIEGNYLANPLSEWKLVNRKKGDKVLTIDRDLFNTLVYYDETSPTCLRWNCNRFTENGILIAGARHHSPAGSCKLGSPNYYSSFGYKRRNYLVHRVVYTILIGEIPEGMVVNHIDNDRSNNKISNLEICTVAENNQRTVLRKSPNRPSSKSGVLGITSQFNRAGNKYWTASWKENEKPKSKCFSVLKLGEDQAFTLACEYRLKMVETHYHSQK